MADSLPSPGSCPLCGAEDLHSITTDLLLFQAQSYAPDFHRFGNWLCAGCGVAFSFPRPNRERLIDYYNGAYRLSQQPLSVEGRTLALPLQFDKLTISFQRFANFCLALNTAHVEAPRACDLIVDFGAYQGMFLYAAKEMWGCRGIAVDYSKQGIKFAQTFLGLTESRVTADICAEEFPGPVRFATLVHSLEHLECPGKFLSHLRSHVLAPDGWLYIEVPNLFGAPLNDPTHFFSFSPESLRWLLESFGFEIVTLFTTGEPATPDFLARNDEENLVCLAKPAPLCPSSRVYTDAVPVISELRRRWSAHARGAVLRQARLAAFEGLRAAYYAALTLAIEPLLPQMAIRLRHKFAAVRSRDAGKSNWGVTHRRPPTG